jgi:hypothetical protein
MTYASSAARRSAPVSRRPRRAKSSSIGIGAIAFASLLVPCVVLAGGYLMSAPFSAGSVAWAAVPMQVEMPVRADPPARRGDRLGTSRSVIDVPGPVVADADVTGSLRSADVARCSGDRIAREALDFLHPPRVAISDLFVDGRGDFAEPPCLTLEATRAFALASPASGLLLAPDAAIQLTMSAPRPNPAKEDALAAGTQRPVKLASLGPLPPTDPRQGLRSDDPRRDPGSLLGPYHKTAIYDISARKVYLPDGRALEAHSGLGAKRDDPRFVHVKMQGATPPNVYDLTLRESLFHGVRALRLNPVAGSKMHGRDGILAHTYMLGPSGQSNGCVSFRNYPVFLQAYLKGDVKRLIVVSRLAGPPPNVTMARGADSERVASSYE